MPCKTDELNFLREKSRSYFKVIPGSKVPTIRFFTEKSKATYQKAIRAAKCKAWVDFRARATSGDTFKALASFTGNSKSVPLPRELLVNE